MIAVIKVHGTADGTPFKGDLWIEDFDVDAVPAVRHSLVHDDGSVTVNCAYGGVILLTRDRARAMQFASAADAMVAWHTRSRRRPNRPDGEPNKPLTGLTVEVLASWL